MRLKYILILIIISTVFCGFSAYAQVRETDITLSISPKYPNPGENVNATLNSYTIDLDKANISWSVDNQMISVGIGKKSVSFKMGSAGSPTTVYATIDTITGQSLQKSATITPGSVDLLFEAYDSYVPPFYKGKALPASQGSFKVVAMPNISGKNGTVSSNNLSYKWVKDDNLQPDGSGWGKNYFTFQNSYLDKGNTVTVTVSDITGGINASSSINLQVKNPKIIFYENDPTLGTKWQNALSDGATIRQSGEIIDAEPYFFSPADINSSDLTFDWYINGDKIQTPDAKNILYIKPEAGQSGNAIIKLVVNNVNTLFQSLTKQIQVSF